MAYKLFRRTPWYYRAFYLSSRITIFVIIISVHFNANASQSLCKYLLGALAEQAAPIRPGNARVKFIIDLLKVYQRIELNQNGSADGYEAIVRKLESSDQTIHSYDPSRSYPDDRVILTLPKPNQPTVWELLTVDEREWLSLTLEHILRIGTYDREFENTPSSHSKLWYALQRVVNYKNPLASGISPTEMLHHSARGCVSGVCRQGASVLAGLLGELGIPGNQIRLVSGKTGPEAERGHIWVEIQLVKGANQWLILDPTPKSQNPSAEIRYGSSNSNRRIYSYDVKVHNDFLIPIVLPQYP